MFDLIIRRGTVIDGTGADPFEADVAISGGKIVAIGKVAGRGSEEIDARGLLVTPGFVDPHTHYDGQATWSSRITPSSWNGVTTTLFGNCGVGFAPCQPSQRDMLVKLMELFPSFVVIGAGLLGYVAGDMAVGDPAVKTYVDAHMHYLEILAPIVGALFVIVAGKLLARQKTTAHSTSHAAPAQPSHAEHAAL